MNYEGLIKALRCKRDDCEGCGLAFFDKDEGWMCQYAAKDDDAAAAIEALLKENKELIEDHPEMVEADGHWEWRKPNGEVLMPKRGEWVEENRRPRSSQFVCSECHRTAYDPQPTRDKAWRKRCRYAYCPNCGAKMEVQDGQ